MKNKMLLTSRTTAELKERKKERKAGLSKVFNDIVDSTIFVICKA
jgi:hypothetical protein